MRTRPGIYYHFLETKEEEEQRLMQESLNPNPPSNPPRLTFEFVERNNQVPCLLHLFPWDIRKIISEDDLDPQIGIEINPRQAREHMLKHWEDRTSKRLLDNGQQVPFTMLDLDTNTEYQLCFRKWPYRERYFIQRHWHRDFVVRRNLRIGMTVGMYWDIRTSILRFSILNNFHYP